VAGKRTSSVCQTGQNGVATFAILFRLLEFAPKPPGGSDLLIQINA